jgi:hypothetical protein
MDKLADLEAQLEHSVSEKSRLEGDVELCTQKLERAEKLIQVCALITRAYKDPSSDSCQKVSTCSGYYRLMQFLDQCH